MSATIYVTALKRVDVERVDITYNLGPMLHEAGMEWSDFTDLSQADLVTKVRRTLEELRSRPDAYRKFNPANNWGSYEVLIASLEKILHALLDPENHDVQVRTWL